MIGGAGVRAWWLEARPGMGWLGGGEYVPEPNDIGNGGGLDMMEERRVMWWHGLCS